MAGFSLTTALVTTALVSLLIAVFLFILSRSERSRPVSSSYSLLAGAYTFNALRLVVQLPIPSGGGWAASLNVVGDLFYLGFISLFWLGVKSYAAPGSLRKRLLLLPLAVAGWVVLARCYGVPFPWLAIPSHLLGTLILAASGYCIWQLHRARANWGHLALAVMMWVQSASTASYPFTRNTWYAPYGFSLFALLATALGMGFMISALKEEQAKLLEEMNARRLAEEDRIRSHALIESITSNSPAGIAVFHGSTGKCLLANQTMADLTGGSTEQLLESNFRTLRAWRGTGLDRVAEATLLDGTTRQLETTVQTIFGKSAVIDCSLSRFEMQETPHLLFIALDASTRKRLESQLLHSQKMESVGRLAGGIAHDFNNLLTPIFGYADLLKMDFSIDSREYRCLDRIVQAADKARALTHQLLGFGRKQILEMKILDLNSVITDFYDILRRTIRENIDLRLNLTDSRCGIRADRNQLEQIILNLTINGQDAVDGNGAITIETAVVTLDEEYVRHHSEVAAGEYLMLAITDNGCGMNQQTLENIFEPFFTTKAVGKGTGLGLAMVHGLVKQHGGHIWVYSEPHRGTVFKIYFPVVREFFCEESAEAAGPAEVAGGNSTILLVEDDEMVRNLVFDLLNSSGYNILVANGPKEALALSKENKVDMLLTDVVMPEITGPELHQKLLEEHGAIKVLYMSGYTNNVIVHHGVLYEGVNFIQKPFALNDLALKIEKILKAPQASQTL